MTNQLSIDFEYGDESGTVKAVLEALEGFVVDLDIPNNTGYPDKSVSVVCVDADGDLVVRETNEHGRPIVTGGTWAIPSQFIRRIRVALGDAA